jgi:hypothetical protein
MTEAGIVPGASTFLQLESLARRGAQLGAIEFPFECLKDILFDLAVAVQRAELLTMLSFKPL